MRPSFSACSASLMPSSGNVVVVERDGAAAGERHQFGQLVVGAADVAHEAGLREQRLAQDLDVEGAAVADEEIDAVRGEHPDRVVLSAALTDVVDHYLGAAAGQVHDLGEVAAVVLGEHSAVGAPAGGALQRRGRGVDDDDLGLGQGAQCLDTDVPKPACTQDHGAAAWVGVDNGCSNTASPTLTCVTPDPTSATHPAVSWPQVKGRSTPAPFCIASNWPSHMWMSVRQKPAAPTRTITSCGAVITGSSTGLTWKSFS